MKNKKKLVAATATTMAVALVLTGTLAWVNLGQAATNEIAARIQPGARLHDDYNGLENKDIYVENFTTPDDGQNVYVRVRLREYMETGSFAGELASDGMVYDTGRDISDLYIWKDATDGFVKAVSGDVDKINDPVNWTVHKVNADTSDIEGQFSWTTGGSVNYMPTFNRDKDSTIADANGSFYATITDPENPMKVKHYNDYIDWSETTEATAYAIYDKDSNADDEWGVAYKTAMGITGSTRAVRFNGVAQDASTIPSILAASATNIYLNEETHTATSTEVCEGVVAYADWSGEKGAFWVMDTDGWYYWAMPVVPGAATGLLVDKISKEGGADVSWFYGLNVEMEALTYDAMFTPSGDPIAASEWLGASADAPLAGGQAVWKAACGK